jgi:membrane protease YdiL (CAAX protease family)
MGASAVACLLALLAAPLWFPGFDLRRLSPGRASIGHWAAGIGVGGLLAFGLVQLFGPGHVLWTMLPSFIADLEDARVVWLGVVVVGIVVEELLFRGILVDGLTGVSGERNAAIASVLLFLVHTLHPFLLLHAAAAAGLRVWSGSPWPGIALRVVASLGALALLGM